MSVLRDAKELGYGSDHFMITGENFPSEWEDNTNVPAYNHEYSDKQEHPKELNTLSHREYSVNQKDSVKRHNKIAPRTIDMQKSIIGYECDISEYIKNMGINEARKQGVIVQIIECSTHGSKGRYTLDANIKQWIKNEDVLIDSTFRSESAQFEGLMYEDNDKARVYIEEKIFSNFSIKTRSRVAPGPGHLIFMELTERQLKLCKEHKNYDPKGTPTMLQIAFGLMKKYEDIEISIVGVVPGVEIPRKRVEHILDSNDVIIKTIVTQEAVKE